MKDYRFKFYNREDGEIYGPLNASEFARLGQLENGLLEEQAHKIGRARDAAGHPAMSNEPPEVRALRAEQQAMFKERELLTMRSLLWEPTFCRARILTVERERGYREETEAFWTPLMSTLEGVAAAIPTLKPICREARTAEEHRERMTAIALALEWELEREAY